MHDDIQIAGLIFVSNEYDKISKLTGNRDVVARNVEKKKKLIEEHGFKTTNPIIVDMEGAIIDGQHRKEAAKELDVPFNFMVDTDSDNALQTAIVFNTSTMNWTIQNFIDAYAQNGNENYAQLLKLQKEFDIDMSKTLILYFAHEIGTPYHTPLKNGTFVFKEEKATQARVIYNEWQQIIDATLVPGYKNIVKTNNFLGAFISMRRQEKFEFNVLLDQFTQLRYTYLDPRHLKESLYDVYNYKRRKKLAYRENKQ